MKVYANLAVVTLLLALPAAVLALGQETFGNAPMVKQPEWADGVVEVVNLRSRVYSQWVNGNENFFYRGDLRAFNEALRQYAAVQDELRELILLPGSGQTQSFDRKPIPFDWQLHVPSGLYKAASKRKHAVLTVYINARKPRPVERKRVEKWLAELNSEAFETRAAAEKQLEELGNDARPILRAALQAQPALESRRRIEALLDRLHVIDVSQLEIPKGITVISVEDQLTAQLKALSDPERDRRSFALQDLSRLAPYSAQVVPALVERLEQDKDEHVRRVAAGCLQQAGVHARVAVPALKHGLDNPDAYIRDACRNALEQIKNARETPEEKERLERERTLVNEINEFKSRISSREPVKDK